jgi:tRNA U34 5-methylaminomethyl-2-thiouridine-forming methyltransferase MnmC
MKVLPPIVTTEDGSITCSDADTGELYHNRAGAFTEALLNYVSPCALPSLVDKQTSLRVLDVCFGLGYNSFVLIQELLALIDRQKKPARKFCLDLLGLDNDPQILNLTQSVLCDPKFDYLVSELKRASPLASDQPSQTWQSYGCRVITLGASEKLAIRSDLRCVDIREELPRLALECAQSFDFIFHDGFSPRRMPELWTIDLFAHYVKLLKPNGKILTYSAATAVRGALKALGFDLMRTKGVGGKSGGTLALRQDDEYQVEGVLPLAPEEENRLQSRSAIPYRDPSLSDSRREILQRREEELSCSQLLRLE